MQGESGCGEELIGWLAGINQDQEKPGLILEIRGPGELMRTDIHLLNRLHNLWLPKRFAVRFLGKREGNREQSLKGMSRKIGK